MRGAGCVTRNPRTESRIHTYLKAARVTEVGQERVERGRGIGSSVAPAAVDRAAAVERQIEAAEGREGALAGAGRGLHRRSSLTVR